MKDKQFVVLMFLLVKILHCMVFLGSAVVAALNPIGTARELSGSFVSQAEEHKNEAVLLRDTYCKEFQ